jgi:glycosyltransferase involved in cell wall biosynthesis
VKKISCIIPAFNEEERIASVLDTVLEAKRVISMEIIVVDDGSTDRTAAILSKYKDIRAITNRQNIGKSSSVAKGLKASKGEYIFLLDSDLFGLKADNIFALLSPIQEGVVEVTMSIRRNLTRRDKLEPLTGDRVFPRSLIATHVEEIKKLPNFGLEVFINNLIIKHGYAVKAVDWDNVLNKNKSARRGFLAGWDANIKAARDVFKVVSFAEFIRQYFALRKLLVKDLD